MGATIMNASLGSCERRSDDFAGKLADAALAVTAKHGVRGPSVERELELWHSLGDVVRDSGCAPCRDEGVLARLTDAAYHVALAHGARGPFVDLELGLWHSLRRAMFAPGAERPGRRADAQPARGELQL
jgi:hypothetical protein